MATRVRRITPDFLKKMILDEAKKLQKETLEMGKDHPEKVSAEEVDADEYADTLEKEIDHMKALKIHEQKLASKLEKIKEERIKLQKKIASKI